jgi:hypothetical protein
MNISGAASLPVPSAQPVKAYTEKIQTEKTENPVMSERVRMTIEKLMAPMRTGMTNEDLDEVDEFLKTASPGPGFSSLGDRMKSWRSTLLWGNELDAAETLNKIEGVYTDFKKNLHSTWPKLADKVFGFTVTEDGYLQVTATPNTLSAWEKNTLNTLLNEDKDLRSLTVKHAKAVIELMQCDQKYFGGKLTVDLTDFHKKIDYGLLFKKGALDLWATDSWLDQLRKKSEKDLVEKKQGLHIEV